MTDDSFVHENNVQHERMDPLTAPNWSVVEGEEALLDPLTAPEPQWVSTSAPKPPSVDQILRGEYTGWVPIIKAGESLQDAETRAEEKLNRIEATIDFETTVTTLDVTEPHLRQLPSEVLEPLVDAPATSSEVPVRKPTAWINFVEDPDTAKSPAAALEEARVRIQAMRDSLQYNIRRVSESFEHPVFNEEVIEEQAFTPPVEEPRIEEPIVDEPIVVTEVTVPLAATPLVEEVPQQSAPTVVIDAPAHEYVTSAPFGETIAEPKTSDTSLELMIMRDEIKDLRTRLDASQKLIEDLMHRLTNLTELALKSRQN